MKVFWFFNILIIYTITFVLSYSLYQEFILLNPPCAYCILQRFFLAGAGVPLAFNAIGLTSYKNVSASVLACVLGSLVSLYQWSGLLINDGVTHAPTLFSLPMYVWAAILFFGIILLLLFMLFTMKEGVTIPRNWFINLGLMLFIAVLVALIVVTVRSCGFLLC